MPKRYGSENRRQWVESTALYADPANYPTELLDERSSDDHSADELDDYVRPPAPSIAQTGRINAQIQRERFAAQINGTLRKNGTDYEAFMRITVLIPKELEAIAKGAARHHLEDVYKGPRADDAFRENLLEKATYAAEHIQDAVREIAINYILNGQISRARAAELLHIHQGTLGKWVIEERERRRQQEA